MQEHHRCVIHDQPPTYSKWRIGHSFTSANSTPATAIRIVHFTTAVVLEGDDQWDMVNKQQQKSYSMPRSCVEARTADPSLPSGSYYVDPDGTNIGNDPIYVYCNMSTGNLI